MRYYIRKRDGRWELLVLQPFKNQPIDLQMPIFIRDDINDLWAFLRFRNIRMRDDDKYKPQLRHARAN